MRWLRLTALAAASLLVLRAAFRVAGEAAADREALSRLRREWTTIKGVASDRPLRVHARTDVRASAGPAAILVHGYGIGSTYFAPLAAGLSAHTRVYAPDLPGHGPSDHDVRPLTIPELAEALARWMDGRGLRSTLVVGHSMGCQVAAELAMRRADLVAGMLLVAPTSDPSGRTVAQQLARGLVSCVLERPSYVIWASLEYRRAGLRVLAQEARDMISHRIEEVLPHVHAPAEVVRGARDRLVSRAWAETVAARVRAPAPVTVPGWGHLVHFDDPAAIADIALALLRRSRSSARL